MIDGNHLLDLVRLAAVPWADWELVPILWCLMHLVAVIGVVLIGNCLSILLTGDDANDRGAASYVLQWLFVAGVVYLGYWVLQWFKWPMWIQIVSTVGVIFLGGVGLAMTGQGDES